MIVPELPAYLTKLGGGDYKGLIISLFTVTALLSRPFSGKLADRIGRVPVMMFGSIVCIICSFIYPVMTTVNGFLLLRLVHGFSTGFTPTGQSAYLSDIIPPERRGEGMGLLGAAGTLGMAAGLAIGSFIADAFGLEIMFYCSSGFAVVSVVILIGLRETLDEKHRFHPRVLKVKRDDLFEPRVLAPCLVMGLCGYSYGAIFTVMPDLSQHMDIKYKGLLFSYLTVALLVIRLVGGKASDRWGRIPVLRVSSATMVLSMLLIALAQSKELLIVGVVFYGFAHGISSPTLLAWATDLSHHEFKGRGIASVYIFMELGIGVGAFTSGLIYGNNTENFFSTFTVCSVLAALAFLYLSIYRRILRITS